MKKRSKRILIISAAAVLTVGIVVGIVMLRNHKITVYVEPVEYLDESWMLYNMTLSGIITNTAEQKIYLDAGQTVASTYVKAGDTVKKGDQLFKYNTEAEELSIAEKELSIEICKNDLNKLEQQLAEYEAIVPVAYKPTEPPYEPQETGDAEPDQDPDGEDPETELDSEPETPDADDQTSYYTYEEKQQLIQDTQQRISKLKNDLGVAENDLSKSKLKLDDAVITAGINGKVTAIGGDGGNEPFCVVTSSDGIALKGYLSEFDLDSTAVGDTVTVSSYSGAYTEAVIQSIDRYPADARYLYREGNQNTSYYTFTALMDDASGFEAGEEVQIQKDADTDSSAIVLPKVYIRTDDEGAYAMIDDNGRLKKQPVVTERCPQSNNVIITEGLSYGDKIAFPYGNGLKEGARTTTEYSIDLF